MRGVAARRLAKQGAAAVATEMGHGRRGVHDVVIVAAKRTPMGAFQGRLAGLSAVELGGAAVRAAVRAAGIDAERVQEAVVGNVLGAGLGQAPARRAALAGGLSERCVCTGVNKVCASGMKAVMLAAQSVALGASEWTVAGGMESMSNAPYLLARRGAPARHVGELRAADSLVLDGLRDAGSRAAMGECAEQCAEEMGISRADQDDHAVASYRRAAAAHAAGALAREIEPVEVPGGGGLLADRDEECARFDEEKLRSLSPAFKEGGTVTAGNSSTLADGAAAVVVTTAAAAEREGVPVLARVRGFGDAEQRPERFPTSPALAIPVALGRAGLALRDMDLFEINEAFSVVDIANRRLLGLSPEQVNLHGGAVSLGHPLGASGARIVVALISALAAADLRVGVAAVCNGGGGASAIVLERVSLE